MSCKKYKAYDWVMTLYELQKYKQSTRSRMYAALVESGLVAPIRYLSPCLAGGGIQGCDLDCWATMAFCRTAGEAPQLQSQYPNPKSDHKP